MASEAGPCAGGGVVLMYAVRCVVRGGCAVTCGGLESNQSMKQTLNQCGRVTGPTIWPGGKAL